MSRMKLLPRLLLDQIRDAPSRPQRGAIAQSLRTLFQTCAQLLQLLGLQAGSATGSCRLGKCFAALFLPGPMPAADRLTMNAQSPGNFSLVNTAIEKPGRFESPPFELIKITFYAFGIAHARRLAQETRRVTILCEAQ